MVLVLLMVGTGWDLYRAAEIRRAGVPSSTESSRGTVDAPSAPDSAPPTVVDSGGLESGVDLNRATLAELDALPGIGPVLARRIVEHRLRHGHFHRLDELRAIPGIGPALLRRLQGLARVGPTDDTQETVVRNARNPVRPSILFSPHAGPDSVRYPP